MGSNPILLVSSYKGGNLDIDGTERRLYEDTKREDGYVIVEAKRGVMHLPSQGIPRVACLGIRS